MLQAFRPVVYCLLLVLLTGCSSTRFFYNRLDFLIPWYLSGYVDLERGQRQLLKDRVDALLGWHRRSELPRYAALLARAEQSLDSRVTLEAIETLALSAEHKWLRLRDRALDELIAVGEVLSDDQVAAFIGALREKQEEYEEKYLDRDDDTYREEACESLIDNLEDYLGRLGRDRQRESCAMLEELRRADAIWLAERQRWLDWLQGILQRPPGWQDELRSRVTDWDDTVSPAYLAIYEHNTQLLYAAVADAVDGRSERQDRHLRRKLAGLREDFTRLSAP
ncbi:MAG: DUF6279 family lipoprotein [Chromatocurvus sp.]